MGMGTASRRQLLVALLANMPSFCFGVFIGWMSPMGPLLQSPLTPASAPLSDLVVSWMASGISLGATLGTPFFTYTSDAIGRKPSLMLISLVYALSWSIKLTSTEPVPLIAARLLAGLGTGGIYVVTPIYVREIAEESVRGALGSIMMFACNAGVIVAYLLGVLLSYHQNLWLYLAIPLLHIALFFFVPESPAYYIKRNKPQEAAISIAWLRGLDVLEPAVEKELDLTQSEELAFNHLPKVTVLDLVRNRSLFRSFRMSLVVVLTETLCGCFAVINFAALIFYRAGTQLQPEYLALVVAAMQLLGSVLSICVVERFGRKVILATSTLVISGSMCTLASWFLLDRYDLPLLGYIPVCALCLCIFSYGAGLTSLPYIILAELFTIQVRALVIGAVICLSWTVSIFTVMFFMPLANMFGEHVVFYLFAMTSFCGAMYTIFRLPETKGKSLEEIQREIDSRSASPALCCCS